MAFLPAEPCIVRKPTFGTDADLAAVDFTREGLFAQRAVIDLWGEAREVTLSATLPAGSWRRCRAARCSISFRRTATL